VRGERGFALVITLIVTALLVALLVEFVSDVYVDTSHSHNFVASQQAGILAESAVAGGIQLLRLDLATHQGYSSLLDKWAQPQAYDAGEGTVTLSIEEESGKLNLNTATSPNGTPNAATQMAVRLLKKLQLSTDLADVLMDWVDENDAPLPGGAETSYYSSLKLPYAAKNARLETVGELALLKGYTPEVITKLRPCVTVYGSAADAEFATKINVNTAPREVLASLDDRMSDDLVDRIMEYRKTKPIKNLLELNSIPGIDAVSTAFVDKVTYSGSVYRIRSEGRVRDSVSAAEAVIRLGTGLAQPTVIYWREY
jgi:general secretion pathway protein K